MWEEFVAGHGPRNFFGCGTPVQAFTSPEPEIPGRQYGHDRGGRPRRGRGLSRRHHGLRLVR